MIDLITYTYSPYLNFETKFDDIYISVTSIYLYFPKHHFTGEHSYSLMINQS